MEPIGNATATDIDFVTITNDAPELYVIGTTHVTWTATDASGNTAVQVQSVTIQDTTSPSVIAPDDIVSEATAVNTPINTGTANAYDAIGIVSITNDAPTTFLIGTTLITWTAIDEAGNTAFAVQQISIVDSTSPIVTAPANLIVEAESSSGASADIGIAVAEDIGDVKISNNAPEIFPLGETQVTWTATDASGNVASAVQSITVSDTITVCIALATLPDASVAVHVTCVSPSGNISGALFEISTSPISSATAMPISALAPLLDSASAKTSAGGVKLGAIVSWTVTICIAEAVLPVSSVAVHVTCTEPIKNNFGALFETRRCLLHQ